MRNYRSDHFAIRVRLLRRLTRCHSHYLQGRREFPLKPPPAAELRRVDVKFQTINNLEPFIPTLKRPPCPLWVSPKSIRLIDTQAALCHNS